jgi:hypothetical protein
MARERRARKSLAEFNRLLAAPAEQRHVGAEFVALVKPLRYRRLHPPGQSSRWPSPDIEGLFGNQRVSAGAF